MPYFGTCARISRNPPTTLPRLAKNACPSLLWNCFVSSRSAACSPSVNPPLSNASRAFATSFSNLPTSAAMFCNEADNCGPTDLFISVTNFGQKSAGLICPASIIFMNSCVVLPIALAAICMAPGIRSANCCLNSSAMTCPLLKDWFTPFMARSTCAALRL